MSSKNRTDQKERRELVEIPGGINSTTSILRSPTFPTNLLVEEVDWGKAEVFFAFAKSCHSEIEFKRPVEKAHRMFHPDK